MYSGLLPTPKSGQSAQPLPGQLLHLFQDVDIRLPKKKTEARPRRKGRAQDAPATHSSGTRGARQVTSPSRLLFWRCAGQLKTPKSGQSAHPLPGQLLHLISEGRCKTTWKVEASRRMYMRVHTTLCTPYCWQCKHNYTISSP